MTDLIYSVPEWDFDAYDEMYHMRVFFWYKGKKGASVGMTSINDKKSELNRWFKKVQEDLPRQIESGEINTWYKNTEAASATPTA